MEQCRNGSAVTAGMTMRATLVSGLLLLASAAPASADTPKQILSTMERVADWELAHADNASQPRNSPQAGDPLGWIVGAFYTGLTTLADRSSNVRYSDAIISLGEREGWKLGPRPFHADDSEVA